MTIILQRQVTTGRAKFDSSDHCIDGAGNVLFAVILNDGYTAVCHVYRLKPDGVGEDVAQVPCQFKADSVSVGQSGHALTVLQMIHNGDQLTQADYQVLQNVCVPYPGQEPQVGMAGAYEGEGGGPSVYEGPTKQEIAAEVLRQLKADVGSGGDLRQWIEDKCKSAIEESGVLRESTVHSSPGLYARIEESVYEVLVNNGVIEEAQP